MAISSAKGITRVNAPGFLCNRGTDILSACAFSKNGTMSTGQLAAQIQRCA